MYRAPPPTPSHSIYPPVTKQGQRGKKGRWGDNARARRGGRGREKVEREGDEVKRRESEKEENEKRERARRLKSRGLSL